MGKRRAKASADARIRRKKSKPRNKRTSKRRITTLQLGIRSATARDRALHVLAVMRRDPSLSLSRASKAEGVKADTVKRYFSRAFKKSGGKYKATKSDRYEAILFLPDAHGNSVPVTTHSFKQRQQVSEYLRYLGRYLRGQRNALSKWHGKKIAGFQLLTAGQTIVAIEPALSEFSLYRAFNGGNE